MPRASEVSDAVIRAENNLRDKALQVNQNPTAFVHGSPASSAIRTIELK